MQAFGYIANVSGMSFKFVYNKVTTSVRFFLSHFNTQKPPACFLTSVYLTCFQGSC